MKVNIITTRGTFWFNILIPWNLSPASERSGIYLHCRLWLVPHRIEVKVTTQQTYKLRVRDFSPSEKEGISHLVKRVNRNLEDQPCPGGSDTPNVQSSGEGTTTPENTESDLFCWFFSWFDSCAELTKVTWATLFCRENPQHRHSFCAGLTRKERLFVLERFPHHFRRSPLQRSSQGYVHRRGSCTRINRYCDDTFVILPKK